MQLGDGRAHEFSQEETMRFDEINKDDDPNALTKFRISKALRDTLKEKGIESLFPIQAMTFNTILDGSDLVGRARTGQGKTLAFMLPILESLTDGPAKASRRTGYGRAPGVLVLLPTRELATQVFSDFEIYGGSLGLKCCCLYGGSPYQPQQIQLKRGVDIVVGTPGRIKDHIDRGTIDLSALKFRVLDEADEMLRMGFVEDVELILGKVEDATRVQTLLFSATLPEWVKHYSGCQIAAKFLKRDKKTTDLVGNEKMKASTNVRHIVLPCSSSARSQIIPDVIRCYSSGGRTIIFTETKDSASTLAGLLPGAHALHGDIQQATREVTLSSFRSGKFSTLVATNVAARGLDIDDVQLIIQCEPPRDVEAYIHRSGRTGRAGKTGIAVMLYDPRKSNFSKIERESGVKFEHMSAPQPEDIAKVAGAEAAETIAQISDRVIPVFKAAAEELVKSSVLSPVELLSKALAKIAVSLLLKVILKSRVDHFSLQWKAMLPFSLSADGPFTHLQYDMLTCLLLHEASMIGSIDDGSVRLVHNIFLPEEKVESIRGLSLTADGKGAVFDVASEDLDHFIAEKSFRGKPRSGEIVATIARTRAGKRRGKIRRWRAWWWWFLGEKRWEVVRWERRERGISRSEERQILERWRWWWWRKRSWK
ncbi:hypothetical protein SASPL_149690 [Salvia splendens]|uniref:RNA helicase n=1 Tax=Salvia splendens TaxID=180675 RepID=A0A8X8WC47_SALSN|nr:hypothetical protein SASPL_149690 [Salvia splendens]